MPKSPKKLDDESSLVADAKQREKERAATNRLVLEFLLKSRNQGRGVVPYRFSLLVSKPGLTEIKMHNMDCNRPFLKHLTQLINCSAAP